MGEEMDEIERVLAEAKKKANELNRLAEETKDYGGMKIVRSYINGEKTYEEAHRELLELKEKVKENMLGSLEKKERDALEALDELLKELGKK